MTLVGKKAPAFTAKAVIKEQIIENFSFSLYPKKKILFFFYPLDFTFVCPTELHAFEEKLSEFQQRDTEVVACSVDSVYSHLAWQNTPKEKGGIKGISYPIVSDLTKEISKDFGVFFEEEGVAYRGLFLIDEERIVRHALVNDLFLGRSIDEALRMVDALICYETHGNVCPANWHKGDKTIIPSQEGVDEFFKGK